jgi:hypothetical protein
METVLDTHCIGDWAGPRAGIKVMEKNNLLPLQESRVQKLLMTFLLIM